MTVRSITGALCGYGSTTLGYGALKEHLEHAFIHSENNNVNNITSIGYFSRWWEESWHMSYHEKWMQE
jgi:hypothetical protein